MKRELGENFLKKRKFLVALPLLVLPFITLAFYALGGGRGEDSREGHSDDFQGLNVKLPGANQKEESMLNKMSFYEQAERDSARTHELEKNDPYFKAAATGHGNEAAGSTNDLEKMTLDLSGKYKQGDVAPGFRLNPSPLLGEGMEPNEQKIMMKLAELNKAIDGPAAVKKPGTVERVFNEPNNQDAGSDVSRLEDMMQVMRNEGGEDPELQQLNGTLEKILDIQHPERVSAKIKATSLAHKTQIFPVTAPEQDDHITVLESSNSEMKPFVKRIIKSDHTAFYSLAENQNSDTAIQNAIPAVIQETQSLVNGATVKLRLTSGVYINGTLIPKDHFVYGTASLNDERLTISIRSIRYSSSIYPVSLSVYDMDGMAGIFVSGAILRDVAKESTGQMIQGLGLTTVDPSISAQAASAGIQAAKTLLTRKAKLVKVTVQAGYQVLLKDESQKSE